ncbi:MAG: N4-gp56 family major capsid protein, partial [bacterium]
MAVTTSSTLSALTQYIQRKGLAVADPNLVIGEYGLKNSIPQKNSKTMAFRRYERISPTTGKDASTIKSLVEGTIPTDTQPTITTVTLTLSQYGNLFRVSDQAEWINEVSVDTELMARNSENMAQTIETVYRDGIMAGSAFGRLTDSIGTIGAGARTTVAGKINAVALDKVARILKGADAKFYTEQVDATTKIATQAVRKSYIAVTHPDVEFDLESVPDYVPAANYSSNSGLLKGEVGSYRNIRFVTSTLSKIFPDSGATKAGTKSTTGTDSDTYATLIFGKEAYTVVDLASAANIFYTPASSQDHANPLGQWFSLGWKAMCGSVILNDAWIYRLETVA